MFEETSRFFALQKARLVMGSNEMDEQWANLKGDARFPSQAQIDKEAIDGFGIARAEGEVSQAVDDGLSTVSLNALKRVGVMTQDGVGSGVDGGVGQVPLGVRRRLFVFPAPVKGNDDKIILSSCHEYIAH